MLVAFTADLHYGKGPSGDRAVRDLAERLAAHPLDVLVIAGDVAIADPRATVECLSLFDQPHARKLVIPGNHDLWTVGDGAGADSLDIWRRLFPRSVELGGFESLEGSPVVVDGTAFVGSIGWYDYAFADPRLGLSPEIYRRKYHPGAGRWNDVRHVRWELTDEEFLDLTLERLRADTAQVREHARRIVFVTHHLPFERLVVRRGFPAWMFQNAYLGSPRIGQWILDEPLSAMSVSGHSHQAAETRIGAVTVVNVGTTYLRKRALLYDVDEGGITGPEVVETGPRDTGER